MYLSFPQEGVCFSWPANKYRVQFTRMAKGCLFINKCSAAATPLLYNKSHSIGRRGLLRETRAFVIVRPPTLEPPPLASADSQGRRLPSAKTLQRIFLLLSRRALKDLSTADYVLILVQNGVSLGRLPPPPPPPTPLPSTTHPSPPQFLPAVRCT